MVDHALRRGMVESRIHTTFVEEEDACTLRLFVQRSHFWLHVGSREEVRLVSDGLFGWKRETKKHSADWHGDGTKKEESKKAKQENAEKENAEKENGKKENGKKNWQEPTSLDMVDVGEEGKNESMTRDQLPELLLSARLRDIELHAGDPFESFRLV